MKVLELLIDLMDAGIFLEVDGDDLFCPVDRDQVSPELLKKMLDSKKELMAWLFPPKPEEAAEWIQTPLGPSRAVPPVWHGKFTLVSPRDSAVAFWIPNILTGSYVESDCREAWSGTIPGELSGIVRHELHLVSGEVRP